MSNECRIYHNKKFYLQTNGYWVIREWQKDKKIYITFLAHRWVWENVHGPIPDNMDIHHIDGDKSNNDINNLEMLSRSDHMKQHWIEGHDLEKRMQQLESVRPTEWLKSAEGKKAVSEKGKQVWANRGYHTIICQHCGIEKQFRKWARFCCKTCYMKWRWINRESLVLK